MHAMVPTVSAFSRDRFRSFLKSLLLYEAIIEYSSLFGVSRSREYVPFSIWDLQLLESLALLLSK